MELDLRPADAAVALSTCIEQFLPRVFGKCNLQTPAARAYGSAKVHRSNEG